MIAVRSQIYLLNLTFKISAFLKDYDYQIRDKSSKQA